MPRQPHFDDRPNRDHLLGERCGDGYSDGGSGHFKDGCNGHVDEFDRRHVSLVHLLTGPGT